MSIKKKSKSNQLELNFNGNHNTLKSKINPSYNSRLHTEFKKMYSDFKFYKHRSDISKMLIKNYADFSINKLKTSKAFVVNRMNLIKSELKSFKERNNSGKLTSEAKIYVSFLEKLNLSSEKLIKYIDEYKLIQDDYDKLKINADSLERSFLRAGDEDAAEGISNHLKYYSYKLNKLKKLILSTHIDYYNKFNLFSTHINEIKEHYNLK